MDSPNVDKNRVFDGGWTITSRGRSLDELYREEDARVAASTSAPNTDADVDSDDLDVENGGDYSPDMAAATKTALLDQFSRPDGSVSRKVCKYFLHASGDPEDRESYNVPLAVVDPVSQLVRFHPAALDEAWKYADGTYSGTANRSLQRMILRRKKKAGFDFNNEQNDFISRHGL